MLRALSIAVAALAALWTAADPAAAQSGGNPIRIIVGVQAGASTDTIARLLADKLRVTLGESVIVENKPGAGQRLAMAELLKAPGDGRTMLLGASALYSIVPHIYGERTGFDPAKDVLPVTRVVAFQVGIGAAPQIGVSNIAEFTAWAKANPSRAAFASPGAGTSSHFAGLMLSKAIGVPLTHLPYRGSAPALTDLMGGHIPILSTAFSDLPEHHKNGKLKILAIAGSKRSPAAPDVATLKEQGVDIEFDVAFDMHVKAGASPESVKRLNEALVKAIREPDVNSKLVSMGLQPSGSTAEQLATWQAAEFKLWAEPVRASGFKGE